jgi:hypothetical protein
MLPTYSGFWHPGEGIPDSQERCEEQGWLDN